MHLAIRLILSLNFVVLRSLFLKGTHIPILGSFTAEPTRLAVPPVLLRPPCAFLYAIRFVSKCLVASEKILTKLRLLFIRVGQFLRRILARISG